MKQLNRINSLAELKQERLLAKHQLKIEELETKNSWLNLKKELDMKRIMPDVTELVVGTFQKTILKTILSLFSK